MGDVCQMGFEGRIKTECAGIFNTVSAWGGQERMERIWANQTDSEGDMVWRCVEKAEGILEMNRGGKGGVGRMEDMDGLRIELLKTTGSETPTLSSEKPVVLWG